MSARAQLGSNNATSTLATPDRLFVMSASDHLAREKKGNGAELKSSPDALDITFQLENGERTWHKHIKVSKSLQYVMPKVAKHLNLPSDGIRLSQSRNGKEVDILDDFDWVALKQRTVAESPSRSVIVKVSQAPGPSRPSSPVAATLSASANPSVKMQRKKKRGMSQSEGQSVIPTAPSSKEPTPKKKQKSTTPASFTSETHASGSISLTNDVPLRPSLGAVAPKGTSSIAEHSNPMVTPKGMQKRKKQERGVNQEKQEKQEKQGNEAKQKQKQGRQGDQGNQKPAITDRAIPIPFQAELSATASPSIPGTQASLINHGVFDPPITSSALDGPGILITPLAKPTRRVKTKRKSSASEESPKISDVDTTSLLLGRKRPRSASPPTLPVSHPSTPSPKKRRRRTEEAATRRESSSEPSSLSRLVPTKVLEKYKPAKPSPLSRIFDPKSPSATAIPLSETVSHFQRETPIAERPFHSSSSFQSPPLSPVKTTESIVDDDMFGDTGMSAIPRDDERSTTPATPVTPAEDGAAMGQRRKRMRRRSKFTTSSTPPALPVEVARSATPIKKLKEAIGMNDVSPAPANIFVETSSDRPVALAPAPALPPVPTELTAPLVQGMVEGANSSPKPSVSKDVKRRRQSVSNLRSSESVALRIMREFREKLAKEAEIAGSGAILHPPQTLVQTSLSDAATVSMANNPPGEDDGDPTDLRDRLGTERAVPSLTGPDNDVVSEQAPADGSLKSLVDIAFQTDEGGSGNGQILNVSTHLLKESASHQPVATIVVPTTVADVDLSANGEDHPPYEAVGDSRATQLDDTPSISRPNSLSAALGTTELGVESPAVQSAAQSAADTAVEFGMDLAIEIGMEHAREIGTANSSHDAKETSRRDVAKLVTAPIVESTAPAPPTLEPAASPSNSPDEAAVIPVVAELTKSSSASINAEVPTRSRTRGKRDALPTSASMASSTVEGISSIKHQPISRKSNASDIFWAAYDTNKLTATERQRLARRGECVICHASPTHLQKDCPIVKAGLQRLQEVLVERREEAEQSKGGQAASLMPGIEAIENWIQRLSRVKNRVISGAPMQTRGTWTSPVKVAFDTAKQQPKTGTVRINMATPIDLVSANSVPAAADPKGLSGTQDVEESALQPHAPETSAHIQASVLSAKSDEQFIPQIHLRALQRPRKTGSLSGLSVSDARIETEDSASESESESKSALDSDEDDDQAGSEEDSSSADDDQDSRSATSGTASLSESDPDVASTSHASDDGESVPSDPELALQHFMSKPLSRRDQEAARLSAIHLPASTPLPEAVDSESESEDNTPDEAEQQPAAVTLRTRADSFSSIGDFGDAESQASLSEGPSPIRPPSQIPAVNPAIESLSEASSATTSPTKDLANQSRRFAELDNMTSTSPVMEHFPGVVALNEAIAEEDRPEKEAMNGVLVSDSHDLFELDERRAGRTKVIDGLPSPPSSHAGMDGVATQLDLRFADGESDGGATPIAKKILPSSQTPAPPAKVQEPLLSPIQPSRRQLRSDVVNPQPDSSPSQPSSPRHNGHAVRKSSVTPKQQVTDLIELSPRVRTRSMSKEVTASPRRSRASLVPASPVGSRSSQVHATAPPRTRSTRSASAGLRPAVHSDSGGGIINSQQTPRSRRASVPKSSQVDQLDSSQPYSTPLVQTAELNSDASPSSIPQRQSARTGESPLFMTQGSHGPIGETQAYNAFPSSLPPERQASPSNELLSRSNGSIASGSRRGVAAASPIPEEDEGSTTPVPSANPNGNAASSSAAPDSDVESDNAATTNVADDDDESSIFIPPAAQRNVTVPPRQYSLASSQPSLSIPTLSGLSKEALRSRSFMKGASSQPAKSSSGMLNGLGKDDSSDSDVSNSSDEEVPKGLKGRIAGRRPVNERRRTNGNMAGW